MKFIFVHGFNVSDGGQDTIGKLAIFYRKYCEYLSIDGFVCGAERVEEFKYGKYFLRNFIVWLLRVRFLNDSNARALASSIKSDCIVIGHSNGCAIANKASFLNPHIKRMVFINPALDCTQSCAETVHQVDVWYSPSDIPVKLSKLLINHPWGSMGSEGYTGKKRATLYTNYNKEEDSLGVCSSMHSDVFDDDKIKHFAPITWSSIVKGIKYGD